MNNIGKYKVNEVKFSESLKQSLRYNAPIERKLCRHKRNFEEYYYFLRLSTFETIRILKYCYSNNNLSSQNARIIK